ncbi:MAG: hypothetical protein ACW98D_16890 [Promethearchaeota archaeon]|jgi:RNase P subunit RPR2
MENTEINHGQFCDICGSVLSSYRVEYLKGYRMRICKKCKKELWQKLKEEFKYA